MFIHQLPLVTGWGLLGAGLMLSLACCVNSKVDFGGSIKLLCTGIQVLEAGKQDGVQGAGKE